MPVHQVGNLRLLDPEQDSDFLLFELSAFEQLIDMKSQFCTCEQLVGILNPQVSKDVAGAFLEFGACLIVIFHV